MDLTAVPSAPIRPSRTNTPRLESIHFSGSTIEDPYAIAKWIGNACVGRGIKGAKDREFREDSLWAQVRNTVAFL
jgi:hypothetical protein